MVSERPARSRVAPRPTPLGSLPQPRSSAPSHPHLLPGPIDRATELPKLVPRAAAACHLEVGGTCSISGPTQGHLSQSLHFNGTPSFMGLLSTAAFRPWVPPEVRLHAPVHICTSLWNLHRPGTAPAEALGPPCSPSCVVHLGSWPGPGWPRSLPQQPRGPSSGPSARRRVEWWVPPRVSEGTLPAVMLLSSHQVALSSRVLPQGHLL